MEESLKTACAAAFDAVKRKKEAEKEEEKAIEKAEQAHEEAYTLQLIKSEIEKLKVREPVQHYNYYYVASPPSSLFYTRDFIYSKLMFEHRRGRAWAALITCGH